MRVLRQRGLDYRSIAQMSAIDAFEEYCGFYGLLKSGHEFARVLDNARALEDANPAAPKALAVFVVHCAKRNVKSMAHSLVQVLDNIRACERLPAERLKQAA